MKKITLILSAALLIAALAGCSGKSEESSTESSEQETTYSAVSTTESSQISIKRPAESSVVSQVSEESRLPEKVTVKDKDTLNYKDSASNLNADFPKEFDTVSSEYKPSKGIYLSNPEGTATLQIEAVKNPGISSTDLVDYLKKKYPSADVSIDNKKKIICKTTVKNSKGQTVASYLKAEVTTEGYNELILYFQPEDKAVYEQVFNKINFV